EDEARRARASLTAIPNIGDVTAELLYQNGFKSAEELAESDEETVADIDGIGPERAGGILVAAREHVVRKREEEAAVAAGPPAAGVLEGVRAPPRAGTRAALDANTCRTRTPERDACSSARAGGRKIASCRSAFTNWRRNGACRLRTSWRPSSGSVSAASAPRA